VDTLLVAAFLHAGVGALRDSSGRSPRWLLTATGQPLSSPRFMGGVMLLLGLLLCMPVVSFIRDGGSAWGYGRALVVVVLWALLMRYVVRRSAERHGREDS
jgi:hypothetical protein